MVELLSNSDAISIAAWTIKTVQPQQFAFCKTNKGLHSDIVENETNLECVLFP